MNRIVTNRLDWTIYQKGPHHFAQHNESQMLFCARSKSDLMSHINGYEKNLSENNNN